MISIPLISPGEYLRRGDPPPRESAELPGVDLAVNHDGSLKLPVQLVRGADAVAQRIRIRLLFPKGSWFLDLRQGIPYREHVLIKNPQKQAVRSILRRVIINTPGVAGVESLTLEIDPVTRVGSVVFRAQLLSGEAIDSRDYPPRFIIQPPRGGQAS